MEAAVTSLAEVSFKGLKRKGTLMIKRRAERRSCAGMDFLFDLWGDQVGIS
jgi:hypothetical protein